MQVATVSGKVTPAVEPAPAGIGNECDVDYLRSVTASGQTSSSINAPPVGQAISYAAGDDGDLQKGVTWPSIRFTDSGDGPVTGNLTGLAG